MKSIYLRQSYSNTSIHTRENLTRFLPIPLKESLDIDYKSMTPDNLIHLHKVVDNRKESLVELSAVTLTGDSTVLSSHHQIYPIAGLFVKARVVTLACVVLLRLT